DFQGVGFGGGVVGADRDGVIGALGVLDQLRGQLAAGIGQRGGEFFHHRGGSRGAGGQQQHGVVGGHAAIGVRAVEAHRGGRAQCVIGLLIGEHRVGGEYYQHGGQCRGEHARALGHAADDDLAGAGFADDARDQLGHGIGGHDAGGGLVRSVLVIGQRLGGGLHTGQQLVHGQLFADQAGGGHGHIPSGNLEQLRHIFG